MSFRVKYELTCDVCGDYVRANTKTEALSGAFKLGWTTKEDFSHICYVCDSYGKQCESEDKPTVSYCDCKKG